MDIFTPEYIQKLIYTNNILTNIKLTDKEQQLINLIKSYPKLEGLIESERIELTHSIY